MKLGHTREHAELNHYSLQKGGSRSQSRLDTEIGADVEFQPVTAGVHGFTLQEAGPAIAVRRQRRDNGVGIRPGEQSDSDVAPWCAGDQI